MHSPERIDEARALLRDRLQRVAVRMARGNALRRRLKQGARDAARLRGRPVDLEQQRRHPGHERRRHRRAREHCERAERDGERREDVAPRRGDRGLEEEVVRRPEAREARDEPARCVREVEGRARLGERDRDGDPSGELVD